MIIANLSHCFILKKRLSVKLVPWGAACFLTALLLSACALSPAALAADNPSGHQSGHLAGKDRLVAGIPVNSPPIAFLNDQGTAPRGLAVDLAAMLAASLKKDIRFVQDTPEGLARRLQNGSIDFIVGVPAPRVIPPDVEIIVTPFALNRRILVASPEAHVTCEQDFHGRRILALIGDPYMDVIHREGGLLIHAETVQEALRRLVAGEADAFVTRSGEVASYVAQRLDLPEVRLMGLPLERIPFVLQVSKNSEDLQTSLTNALLQLENRGTLDLLRDKWLGRSLTGQSFWELYRKPILSVLGGGALLSLLIMFWIITLRRQVRRTTRSLQNSERRYRELIEASPDLTLLVAPDGCIRLANRIAREALDVSPECEPDSLALWDALCESGRVCLHSLLDCARSGQEVREELILHPDQENMRIMEFIAFPTTAGAEGDSLICCIGRDMTERRHLERELIEVERLAVIGKTAASVAHEINNPLGIIMAHTDVALEEVNDKETVFAELMATLPPGNAARERGVATSQTLRSHLEAIQRNVERAAATTKRLLNIAMPPSINQEPQNLTDILKESLAFLRPRMEKVHLDTSRLSENLDMPGDRILLEQLFINLLLNALESMNGEGELALIGQESSQSGKRTLRVEIHDSGKGIATEHLDKIFDPFFTTRGGKGFGLGLYISRRIVEAHKGTLHAECPAGKGACMIAEFAA